MSREKPIAGDVFLNKDTGNLFMLVQYGHSANGCPTPDPNTLVYLCAALSNGTRIPVPYILNTGGDYALHPDHKFLFNISKLLVTNYDELTKYLKP